MAAQEITRDEYKKRVNFFKKELGIEYRTKELYTVEALRHGLKDIALEYGKQFLGDEVLRENLKAVTEENIRLFEENINLQKKIQMLTKQHDDEIKRLLRDYLKTPVKKPWWRIF